MLLKLILLTFLPLLPGVVSDGFFAKVPLFTVPVRLHSPFKSTDPSELKCPPIYKTPTILSSNYSQIYLYRFNDPPELKPVSGYLCSGLTYTITCSEGFFGQRDIHKSIERSTVSPTTCRDTIKDYQTGKYVEPYFPGEECYWMSSYTAIHRFVAVSHHPTRYDKYTTRLVDPLFGPEGCKESICETRHENTLWISDDNITTYCGRGIPISVTLHAPSRVTPAFIKVDNVHYYNLSASCRLSYCGLDGIRVSNGLFYGDPHMAIKGLSKCPATARVGFIPLDEKVNSLDIQLIHMEHRMNCLATVQNIRAKGKGDFLALSHLQPRFPMTWPVYRLNGEILESAIADWAELIAFGSLYKREIGILANRTKFYWTAWKAVKDSKDLSGFNGVHITAGSQIIIPQKELLEMEYSESVTLERDIILINHPTEKYVKKEGLDKTLVRIESKNIADVGGWLTSVWGNFWGKIGLAITVIIGLFVFYLIVRLSIVCCKCRRKPAGAQPLQHFDSTRSRKKFPKRAKTAETSFSF